MSSTTPDLVRKLRQAHRELDLELNALQSLLASSRDDASGRRRLLELIDRLVKTLPRHFQFEEQGGYLAEVVARYPNWSTDVEQLRREHQEMISCVVALRVLVEEQPDSGAISQPIRRQVEEVISHITAHQRHENRLVQEAFNLDVGSAD